MSGASFTAVNYSLRPSKTIQRALVFEGLRRLQEHMNWKDATYLGLGSIWFTDFVMAHKTLRIRSMVSIEANEIGFRRAKFNRPYRFVRVEHGLSFDVIPELLQEQAIKENPLIVWLDYDKELGGDEIDELRHVVEWMPDNSVLLVTFDASDKKYGKDPDEKRSELKEIFGAISPDDIPREELRGLAFGELMATLTSELLHSKASDVARDGGCIPAFKIVYRDKATMATVGIVLPSRQDKEAVNRTIAEGDWPGFVREPVEAPHLTQREASVLQSQLPSPRAMSRAKVRRLGFDLEDEQIRAFQAFYRHYPTFAQIMS